MTFVDTNILLDVWNEEPVWADWSIQRLSERARTGDLVINPIVLAEVSRNFSTLLKAEENIRALDLTILPLDNAIAFLAGCRFAAYRRVRRAGESPRLLPDLLIGAHAATLGVGLLTRDPSAFRRYFPDLTLITPETHP